jgi:hypothetical protein
MDRPPFVQVCDWPTIPQDLLIIEVSLRRDFLFFFNRFTIYVTDGTKRNKISFFRVKKTKLKKPGKTRCNCFPRRLPSQRLACARTHSRGGGWGRLGGWGGHSLEFDKSCFGSFSWLKKYINCPRTRRSEFVALLNFLLRLRSANDRCVT